MIQSTDGDSRWPNSTIVTGPLNCRLTGSPGRSQPPRSCHHPMFCCFVCDAIDCEGWALQFAAPEFFSAQPIQSCCGPNWFIYHHLIIPQKSISNPLRFRFRFRGLRSAHDLRTLGPRHANANAHVLRFFRCFSWAASHSGQCNQ